VQVLSDTDTVYALAKKFKFKTAFDTDIRFSKELADRQGAQLSKMTRCYTPTLTLGSLPGVALSSRWAGEKQQKS
jgi:hypothetical protein